MEFYDFRLMYIESDKKLRDMLAKKSGNKTPIKKELIIDDVIYIDDNWNDDVASDDIASADLSVDVSKDGMDPEGDPNWRWKCTTCFATFEKRKLLRNHRREHKNDQTFVKLEKTTTPDVSFNQIWIDENPLHNSILHDDLDLDLVQPTKKSKQTHVTPTTAIDLDLRWYCKECSARFRTRQLLYDHRKIHKEEKVMTSTSSSSFVGVTETISALDLVECVTIIDSGSDNEEKAILNDSMDSVQLRWSCKKCPKRFRARTQLREHMRDHRRDFDLKKQALIKSIQEKKIITRPAVVATAESTAAAFDDDDFLPDWLQPSGSTSDRWKCKRCPLSFETRRLLQLHNASHRTKPETEDYITLNNADEDATEDANDDEIQSKIESKKEIIDVKNENVSSSQETIGFRWKCSRCNEVFEFRKYLRLHRNVHRDEPRYYPLHRKERTKPIERKSKSTDLNRWICIICANVYAKRSLLREHRRKDHNIDKHNYTQYINHELNLYEWSAEYTCDICDKRLHTKRGIREHMTVHGAGERRTRRKHLCTVCGIWLSSAHNLNIHDKVVHKQERDFQCPHCERSFSFAHHLRAHINRHTGNRPYSCQSCDKKFFECSNLNEHIKSVHLNVKRYVCQVCTKSFNRSGNLTAHMFIHTNRYPHQCGHCNAGFLRKYKLTAHLEQCRKIFN